ncbi:MAG: WD40 repeat domain-containing protein [Cyanobacteria bacterium J06649_5]
MPKESAQEEWRRKTLDYVASVNEFVEKGLRDGWESVGEEPSEPGREHLAETAISAVRQANIDGDLAHVRDQWPPAHSPLIGLLKKNGQSISVVCVLPDNSIVARIGSPYEQGKTVHIIGDTVTDIPDVGFFGRSPNRKYFAIAQSNGIQIVDGWSGPQVALCPWPTGIEGIPLRFNVKPLDSPPTPTRLIPFPDGKRVLLVSGDGIFVLSEHKAVRLLPTQKDFEWMQREEPDEDLSISLSMEHGAVSDDGKLIAVGSQDSTHLVFDESLVLVGNIGNHSEYPHYALFSSDNDTLAFNACHFYSGVTIGIPTKLLPGLTTEPYEEDARITVLEDGARVYAGTSRSDELIVGDADGYIRAFNTSGKSQWQLFIGSSVGDIDISADGKTLVVSTYAGFLSIINLDAGEQTPYQIGNSKHMEVRRWLFWKNESQPLIW